ncbi:hypothetical protein [Methylobacterium sp. 174MFSha1.1]|uniref:hypothetical protein n=1 Tax=Methylobacterium sp. 174MFSha1.1 TaxID=1502749 RepID=UPI000A63F4B5|nr:hypothetical protein [Methylobacterium sp. 174MFSha1.1]
MTAAAGFTETLARFGAGTPVVLCHDDADGLSAGALLARALARTHYGPARVRVIGRGESAWSDAVRAELAAGPPVAGLVVADLGVQAEPILPGVPTILVDHHVPRSEPGPEVATVISGYGAEPTPTSSLLAQACAAALVGEAEAERLVWLAALGAVGDLGERASAAQFPAVMAGARRFGTLKALREAVSLVNAPRRSSRGDAAPALRLLLRADGPDAVVSDASPDGEALRQARAEVKQALDAARKLPPQLHDYRPGGGRPRRRAQAAAALRRPSRADPLRLSPPDPPARRPVLDPPPAPAGGDRRQCGVSRGLRPFRRPQRHRARPDRLPAGARPSPRSRRPVRARAPARHGRAGDAGDLEPLRRRPRLRARRRRMRPAALRPFPCCAPP